MSVIKYHRQKYLQLAKLCRSNSEIIAVFRNLPHYIHFKEGWLRELPVNDYIDRMFWYLYVANRTAFNIQYSENSPFEYDEKIATPVLSKLSYKDIEIELGSIDYNTFTNSGTCFIDEGWMDSLHLLRNFLCKEYKIHHDKELKRIRKKWNLTTKFKIN